MQFVNPLPLPSVAFCVLVLASTLATEAQAPVSSPPLFDVPTELDDLPGEGSFRFHQTFFPPLWSNRRSAWAGSVETDQGAIAFFGDSITQGWNADFRGLFGDHVKLANRGISADTTRGMLYRLESDIIALNPSAVVLLMGTNDIEEGDAPESTASNISAIIARLKEHNRELPIVLNLIFPSAGNARRPAATIQEINSLLLAAVKGDPQVTVIDTFALFANEEGTARPKLLPDLLHPNAKGYAAWAGALRPVLEILGALPIEPDDFTPEEGFVSLFDGHSLEGWGFRPTPPRPARKKPNPNAPVFVEIKEAEDFSGDTMSSDGRYLAKSGRLVVTTPAEGRRIQQLWTTQDFTGDFELRLEFRATPNADSGIFLKGKQLQCRDYPIAGPYTHLKRYRPGDWNEIVIVTEGTKARCTCNGEVLEEAFEIPESGPIGLEGDRGQIEYRRIRIRTK